MDQRQKYKGARVEEGIHGVHRRAVQVDQRQRIRGGAAAAALKYTSDEFKQEDFHELS